MPSGARPPPISRPVGPGTAPPPPLALLALPDWPQGRPAWPKLAGAPGRRGGPETATSPPRGVPGGRRTPSGAGPRPPRPSRAPAGPGYLQPIYRLSSSRQVPAKFSGATPATAVGDGAGEGGAGRGGAEGAGSRRQRPAPAGGGGEGRPGAQAAGAAARGPPGRGQGPGGGGVLHRPGRQALAAAGASGRDPAAPGRELSLRLGSSNLPSPPTFPNLPPSVARDDRERSRP